MIKIIFQLSTEEHNPGWIVSTESSGFQRVGHHESSLGLILTKHPTWWEAVPVVISHLIRYCPMDSWCIRVKRLDLELRRFEMVSPAPTQVEPQEPRISRYSRPPVI